MFWSYTSPHTELNQKITAFRELLHLNNKDLKSCEIPIFIFLFVKNLKC